GAFFENVADPVQRFHVVLKRGPPEEPDLRDVRRTKPRHPTLALDRLDHCRLFTTDVGACAAAQIEPRQGTRWIGFERGDLALEDRAAARVFVAHIDVDVVDADRPRGDQHSLEKAVRIALEVVAVLERAGLAFVDVDGEEPRRGLAAYDPPFASNGKTRAAQATQARILHRLQHVLQGEPALNAFGERAIAAARAIRGVIDVGGDFRLDAALGDRALHCRHGRIVDRVAADDGRRRALAAADTGRADHANVGTADV